MYQAMPDLHVTIEEMIAEGDKVVCRNIWRWTDASGRKMQFHGFVLWRFDNEKIAERCATVTSPSEGNAWTAVSLEKAAKRGPARPPVSNSFGELAPILREFADAIISGDAKAAEQRMLARYPDHHVSQFLTASSIPAYFLSASVPWVARNVMRTPQQP